MAAESGDQKLLGNLRKLIDEVSADPDYNPANTKLKTNALETLYSSGETAANNVAARHAPNKLAISDRQGSFDDLGPLVLRSLNFLKASGASKAVVEDAKTHVRKITGTRKSTKAKPDPATPGAEAKVSHSASQMSYDNQLGNLEAYLALLRNIPAYNPNEDDLKLTSLTAFANNLKAKNDAVSVTGAALNQARGRRDRVLYLDEDSIANTGQMVKAYVKGALGTNSQLYKQIKGLKFVKAAK